MREGVADSFQLFPARSLGTTSSLFSTEVLVACIWTNRNTFCISDTEGVQNPPPARAFCLFPALRRSRLAPSSNGPPEEETCSQLRNALTRMDYLFPRH